jgi:MscS family membrane protein
MDIQAIFMEYLWLFKLLFTVLVVVGALFLEKYIHSVLLNKSSKTKMIIDDCVIQALDGPLRILIFLYGVLAVFGLLEERFFTYDIITKYYDIIKTLAYNILFLWFAIRFIDRFEQALFKLPKSRVKIGKTSIRAIAQVSTIALVILVVLNIMQPVFGVPISALLAFGGIGGIAVALACQDLLSNIFGGMFIYFDRPFDIGDWISSPEKNIEGYVEQIGMRLTKIRTFDKRVRYIPNSVFSKIILDNPSRMSHRRIKMIIGIRYDDAAVLGKVVKDIDAMLRKSKNLDTTMATYARFSDFSASSIDIEVYCFTTETTRFGFLTVKQELAEKIIKIVDKHGAEMAFPTRTIHIASGENEAATTA